MRILIYLVVVILLVLFIGLLLPNPRVTVKTVSIDAPINVVWEKITNHRDQVEWRNDLERVDIHKSSGRWTEVPKVGPSITFEENKKVEPSLYEIQIVPLEGFGGYSVIELSELEQRTKLTIKESGVVSNPLRRILSFVFYNQSKQIDTYIENLRTAVEHN